MYCSGSLHFRSASMSCLYVSATLLTDKPRFVAISNDPQKSDTHCTAIWNNQEYYWFLACCRRFPAPGRWSQRPSAPRGRDTPTLKISRQTPRKWRDLEQYIILDTRNFLQLQKLTKLQRVENSWNVTDFDIPGAEKSYRVTDHRELLVVVNISRNRLPEKYILSKVTVYPTPVSP